MPFSTSDVLIESPKGSSFAQDEEVAPDQLDVYFGMTDQDEISKKAKNSFGVSTDLEIPLHFAEEIVDLNNGEKPERPGIIERGIKGFLNKAFVQPVKNVLKGGGLGALDTDLEALRELRRIKEEEGRTVSADEFVKIFNAANVKVAKRVQGKLPSLRVPPPEGVSEKAVELVTGISAFVTKLALARKVVGGTGAASEIAAFEAVNLADDGTPGVGILLASSLGLIGKVPASTIGGKLAKLGGQGGVLAGITGAEGGSPEDIAVAFFLPSVLATFNQFPALVKGKQFDIKTAKDVQTKIPFMRDVPLKSIKKWSAAMQDAGKVKTGEMTPNRWGAKHGKNLTEFSNQAKQAFESVTQRVKLEGKVAPKAVVKPTEAPVKVVKPVVRPVEPPKAEKGIKLPKAEVKPLETAKEVTAEKGKEASLPIPAQHKGSPAFWEKLHRRRETTQSALSQEEEIVVQKLRDESSELQDAYDTHSKAEFGTPASRKAARKALQIEKDIDLQVSQMPIDEIRKQVPIPRPPAVKEALGPVPPQIPRLGGKDVGATTIIPDIATEAAETSKRLGSTLAGVSKGTKEIFDRNVLRYSDRLKKLGKEGAKVSKDFDEITQRSQKQINNAVLDAKEILKGVSKDNREKIAKAMNKRLVKVPAWIQQRADRLSTVLDNMMNEARVVGIQRRVDGAKVELRGSGKAFPQVPNAAGDKILKAAGKFGMNAPSVVEVAKEAVEAGLATSVESYIAQLQQFRNDQLRGVSSYLERTRVELPERFLEWDPDRVLDALIQRTWLTIEGTRQWGTDEGGLSFPKLVLETERIRSEHGPDEAKLLEQFIKAAFGQELLSTEASRKISGAVRGYQFLTKIAPSPLTILRNMLDRFSKVRSFAPLSVILKTIGDYPPVINAFLKHSRELEEEIIRSGAVFSNTAIGEGYQPGHLFTKLAGKVFASSERGNQVFIALAKKNAINHNLRLLKTNPKVAAVFDKRIAKLLSPLEAIGRSPTQAQLRLRELGDDEFLAKLESVDDISADILDAVLHKTVRDKAFPVVLSTKRSWWDNKPFMRMVTQFKVWGTDQVGHVWNDVIKDSVQTRDPAKMIGWLFTLAITGEVYNIVRDFILGKDESLIATLSDKERRNLKEVSKTIMKDMLDGGAVGILFDVMYGLPNLIGGPTLQTGKNLGNSIVKSIWNPKQAKAAIAEIARKETPAIRQAQGILDKVDARFEEKNITQDYYKVRRQGFDWFFKKKFPTAIDKAKKLVVQAILGWVKNVPQERTLSYEMAIRQIIVGDTEDASEHLFFLLKTARDDEELLSIEQGITSALSNASPLGKIADKDLGDFFRGMSSEQRRTATATQLRYDRNSAEAYGLAVKKFEKWQRENRRK